MITTLLIDGKILHIEFLVNWVINLFLKLQPINATPKNDIRVLHRNMLFPLKTSEESSPKESENAQNTALMKANLLMDIYFDN